MSEDTLPNGDRVSRQSGHYARQKDGTVVWVGSVASEFQALRACIDTYKTKVLNARVILTPLAGKDRTVDAVLAALDGV